MMRHALPSVGADPDALHSRERMTPWAPTLFLEPGSRLPVFQQIAQGLAEEIRQGRFKPGDPLPGYRTIAKQLGVSRNTVIAAYRELQAQGFVITRPVVGSVVASRPPQVPPRKGSRSATSARMPGEVGFALAERTGAPSMRPRGGILDAATGIPDPRLVPGAALARAYRRVVTTRAGTLLGAGDPRGHVRLRRALAAMLVGTRGLKTTADDVFVTRGSQMALYLLAQAICPPGMGVAVEAMGDRRAWDAFARAGARCYPIPVDGDGLDVEALERSAEVLGDSLRAVLVTPHRQYPTLAPLSPGRRARLLSLAAARRLAVLEVDLDSEFQYEGLPTRSLASEDHGGVVVHVGTLSKLFAPALRLGFVIAPAALLSRLKTLRAAVDRHGDPALELAMAELLEDGEMQRHLNRMLVAYRSRRDTLCLALSSLLGTVVNAPPASGGLALWARVEEGVDVDAWAARALEAGVSFRPGRMFAFDGGPVPALRMGFAPLGERELEEAARRMAAALHPAR